MLTSWALIYQLAHEKGAKYPELVAAQWALESGYGHHQSGLNNFFGLKGKGTKASTAEWNGEEFESVRDEFLNYHSVEDCVEDLVTKWYKDYKHYKGVNNADNAEEAAWRLVSEGYATDPDYAEKLVYLLAKHKDDVPSDLVTAPISLVDAAAYFKGEPHQIAAWLRLQAMMTKEMLEDFAKAYRRSPRSVQQRLETPSGFPLDVDYFYQRDSKTGHGERSCQSSAIAMVVDYLEPSAIEDDDEYLNIVLDYGDTVSQSAHQKALDKIGIRHEFRMDGREIDLTYTLDKGYPVPIGILHKGDINNVYGGGHWITLIGYTSEYFMCHDPFGKLDLINGFYPSAGPTDGKFVYYERELLMKRWLIANSSDGWYWDFSMNEVM